MESAYRQHGFQTGYRRWTAALRCAGCIVLVSCWLAGAALAQAPGQSPPPAMETESHTEWYGWQVLGLDALSGVIYLASFSDDVGTFGALVLGTTGAITYAGMSPSVHRAHGSLARAILSFALRTGAVTTSIFLADRSDLTRSDLTVYLPIIAVEALDVLLLSRKTVTRQRWQPATTARGSMWLMPLVDAHQQTSGVMIGGGLSF